ncbi:MAG: ABC transporter ATP-binding protein [Clostridia bacterium]|nr:ABC transporter ATP-binding protein [Clostridia bacterium]MDD4048426.1 ABC transporter ATP-binding protein [Clostridia bacterium]
MENIIEVKGLKKKYEGFSLQDISFNLKNGYIMGFIGPNGAGKTTTIKLLMNLLKKDGGEIKIFGQDNVRYEKSIKDRIGFVYDNSEFYDELNIRDVKRFVAPLYSRWDNKAFEEYIKTFNLPVKKKVKDFSKGMKMKLSLALALSHHAELLIMDEPTSGLDPVFRQEFLDIIQDFMDESKGVLFSSHITSDLDKIADYVTFINNGSIVLTSSKEEVMEKYGVVKGGKDDINDDLRQELIGLHEGKFGFEALISDVDSIRTRYKNLVVERPTMEDIMLYLVREGKGNV